MGLANKVHAEIYLPPSWQRIGVAVGGGVMSVKMSWVQIKMRSLVRHPSYGSYRKFGNLSVNIIGVLLSCFFKTNPYGTMAFDVAAYIT